MDGSDLASIVGLVIAAVALLISVGSLAVTAIGVVVSYYVARWYGGIAAVEASRKLQEEDSKKTRLTALRSLLHQTERIRKICGFLSFLLTSGIVVWILIHWRRYGMSVYNE